MKYTLCMLCLLALSMPAFAQIPKGSAMIGGSIALNSSKSESRTSTDKNREFSFQPTYGYFIINNLCLGAGLSYSTGSRTLEYSDPNFTTTTIVKNKDKSYGVGPFVRYYIPLNDKLYAFASVGYSRNWSKDEGWNERTPQNKNTAKYVYYNFGVAAGISYFFTPNLALDVSVLYNKAQDKFQDNDSFISKSSGIALGAGFNIFLRKN